MSSQEAPTEQHPPALPPADGAESSGRGGVVLTVDALLGVLAGVLVVAGSLGPWVSAGPWSFSGINGDGVITLVAGVVGILVVAVGRIRGLAIAAGLVSAVVAIYYLGRIASIEDDDFCSISIGWGVVAVLTGAIGLLAWSFTSLWNRGDRRVVYAAGALVGAVLIIFVTLSAAGVFSAVEVDAEASAESTSESVSASEEEDGPAETPESRPALSGPVQPIGGQIRLAGASGVEMVATVERVIDPVYGSEFDEPAAGKRYVGVVLRLTNTGDAQYDDSPSNGAALTYGDDREASATIVSGGQCSGGFTGGAKISVGSKRKGCVVFEVPKSNTIKTFQLSLDSGFADQAGEWNVRPANDTAAHRKSSSASDGGDAYEEYDAPSAPSGSSSGSSTACDQNITAGAGTTCAFANEVFKSYAAKVQANGGSDKEVSAYSSATGSTISVFCSYDGTTVSCSGGNDAYVSFPKWAADVY
ncbi:MAG: DUF4352 domain-containing protein [Solirubrobacteraceae bacterium]|nr:DUF4352 domain-containing protein [Solirubrobacteraceae bacterium]